MQTSFTKKQKSQYQKDIVDLIGVDFEEVPTSSLRSILWKFSHIQPHTHDAVPTKQEEWEELVKGELGIRDVVKEAADKAKLAEEKALSCQAFRKNYRRRRSGKMAVRFRLSLGTYMSKRFASPYMSPEFEELMIKTFKHTFPFHLLSDHRLKLMTAAMSKLSMDSGEFLIKEGDFIEKFYYVQSGLFGRVYKGDSCYVTEYFKQGECIGGHLLFFGANSRKTIKCLQGATLWVLDAKSYHSVCHWGLRELHAFLEEVVARTPGLEGNQAAQLVNALKEVRLEGGADVLQVTQRAAMYIVYIGQVRVVDVNVRGDEFERICDPGDTFGSDRLFTKRFAKLQSAVTLIPSRIYYLPSDAFERLCDLHMLYELSNVGVEHDNLFYLTL